VNTHNKRQHTAPAALARAAALVVGHMKFISKIAGITIALLLMTVAFGLHQTSAHISIQKFMVMLARKNCTSFTI